MRWIIRTLGVIVSLVVLAVAALFLIPAERIAGVVAQRFETATGRQMTIAGDVRPSIFPVIGARVEDVSIANPPWADSTPMLQAESVDMGLDLAALLRGDFVVRRFEAVGPRILVERAEDGRLNWLFETPSSDAAPAPDEGGGTGLQGLSLERAVITDAAVRVIDRAAGTDLQFEALDLTLSMPEFDGPGSLTLSGQRGGQAFEAEARIGSVAGILGGEVESLSASLSAGDTEAGFEGRGGLQPLAAEGRVSLQGPGVAPMMALAGLDGGEPIPEAARPLALNGQVTLAPEGSVHLRETSLELGPNRVAMALDLTLDGARPHLSGDISAETLDLRAFTDTGTAGGGDGGNGGGASGWPRDPIDASALGLMDAALAIRLGPVQSGIVDLESLRADVTIDNARAVMAMQEARLFDGVLRGELVANNRSGLSVGGDLNMEGVGLLPLLRQFAGFERLTGTGALDLRFLGVGNSLDAILRSLSGEGQMELGEGEIIGFDLAGMLRNLDLSYMGEENRTIYQSLTGSFTMENGVLRNDDLRMEASRVSVGGDGSVDLGGQSLDYRVIPEALRNAETGEALRVPLLITGPWNAPRFRLDLEGLTEERLREEAERLEERARQEADRLERRARRRLDRELEGRLGGGEDGGEDGAGEADSERPRNRLEQEIGRGLRGLLGGDETQEDDAEN
ncbi:MAG: AsmA protein [Rhodobacteraceae bacterium HLUCCA12]|nr:MAG: AsmA protein [Rhodobacteraceae bacterium HLUCCA12]